MTDSDEGARASGYVSEDAKKRFTVVAGVLGALFFVLQFALPMVAMFAMMPIMMGRRIFTLYGVGGSAMLRGQVYLVETARNLGDMGEKAASVRLVRVAGNGLEDVATLDGWEPHLLSDGRQIWLISGARMARFDGARLQPVEVPEALGSISCPFLLDGLPAVIESRPDTERVMVWRDGGWQVVRNVAGLGSDCSASLLATSDGLLAFRQQNRALFARKLDRGDVDWAVVASNVSHWKPFERDGRAAVATTDSNGTFQVLTLDSDSGRWTPFGASSDLGGLLEDVAVFQEAPGGPLTVVSQGFPGSLKVRTWDRGRVLSERKFGTSSPFPRGMMALMLIPQLGAMAMSVALAVILAWLMRTYRVSAYVHAGREVTQASLTRRAFSQAVDAALVMGPGTYLFWQTFEDFDQLFAPPFGPFRFFAFMGAGFAWAFLLLVLFSVTEGLWGVTPGKWFLGIRVVGTDLVPCGIGRGLIRNVLKLVDGFFNFLIGILMVAYTPEWQRLGDMAARTIVIRTPPAGLRALRAAGLASGGSQA